MRAAQPTAIDVPPIDLIRSPELTLQADLFKAIPRPPARH